MRHRSGCVRQVCASLVLQPCLRDGTVLAPREARPEGLGSMSVSANAAACSAWNGCPSPRSAPWTWVVGT